MLQFCARKNIVVAEDCKIKIHRATVQYPHSATQLDFKPQALIDNHPRVKVGQNRTVIKPFCTRSADYEN